ncbi:MAG: ATP synthase F1 subunit epsilon [Clostridia bacterium]|nr:ATP synthase F1 subunit epsilon [Clostridia bacterium]
MSTFSLKIVTPDGVQFDGECEALTVRTTSGEMGILPGHINCVSPLGMGRASISVNGEKRYAACMGGILTVLNGEVRLVPTTFEWADEIDMERAKDSETRARKTLGDSRITEVEQRLAEARLKRALVRQGVGTQMRVK